MTLLVIVGYSWGGSGFGAYTSPIGQYQREKTVWDWLQLAGIPMVLAGLVWWLNRSEQSRQTALALDRTREERLQSYLDQMTNLLEKGLTPLEGDHKLFTDPLRNLARVRTLTVLRDLDSSRKKIILYFLSNAGLISRRSPGISLVGADFVNCDLHYISLSDNDLSGVDFSGANLRSAVLADVNLSVADLTNADLTGALLADAVLEGTNLTGANLTGADLTGAHLYNPRNPSAPIDFSAKSELTHANLTNAILARAEIADDQLAQAKSLKGAIMPDGTRHD